MIDVERKVVETGVAAVDVDLEAERVIVRGDVLDDARLREAIEEAGYEAT